LPPSLVSSSRKTQESGRISRSIVVNLDRIRGLELQTSGEYEVVLKSKVRLRLSRRYRKRLQDRMGALSERG
jgi:two-component system LytT family response regulator